MNVLWQWHQMQTAQSQIGPIITAAPALGSIKAIIAQTATACRASQACDDGASRGGCCHDAVIAEATLLTVISERRDLVRTASGALLTVQLSVYIRWHSHEVAGRGHMANVWMGLLRLFMCSGLASKIPARCQLCRLYRCYMCATAGKCRGVTAAVTDS